MRRYKLTRVTKTHVYITDMAFGAYPPRGMSLKIPIQEFHEKWIRLPQREVMKKSDDTSNE